MPSDHTYYYDILHVPSSSSPNEIKKAYKKQALKWHPDKNPDNRETAEKMFKEVAEAYGVLSDPQKKRIYDTYGRSGLERGNSSSGASHTAGGYHHYDMNDAFSVFEQFFGSHDPWQQFDDLVNGNLLRAMSSSSSRGGGAWMGMSAFDDPFFTQGFTGQSSSRRTNFANFSSSVSSGGFARSSTGSAGGDMSSGMSQSTSTSTRTVNGHTVTITEKQIRHPDGRIQRSVTEKRYDPRTGKTQERRSIEDTGGMSKRSTADKHLAFA
ncbi:heat shock protein, putative [Perkinsus marinus ATCC 50983]|uniref:Heat shock protein, putative n=2 Tax=Perkinsus marinus (strain ATCC 50983 / TXsc) TaxID=423536 RepID=C5KRG8_PERM5|nr:heat shock protein, putative [Perkinsus marinus ATCC 50983]EER12941.1 heat shock protein, putative [Perkinsus marinus ATCC 50983]|eukprot:XP_002781146.1 heat shock protein, putative [Perkinsus marinus ATCC 50983]